jgi:RNA polymerase sigma factor (sigma-70 family)|tara:strand:+ start:690 stop:1448 length:759 start_codon:yes stop_codon:yes gene_type:complete
MKKYNVNTYKIYKEDVLSGINSLDHELEYDELTRDQLITKFLPLVENIAKKFSTSSQACGVMNILDLIQEGSSGLIKAIDRIDWVIFNQSKYKENTMKSFLSKRIRGAIRRGVDINRSDMRIPEHKLQEIRKNFGKDEKMVAMFFNSIFLSVDEYEENENISLEIEDKSEPKNMDLLNVYLSGLLRKHLNSKEYQVLRLSYGLDCSKHSGLEIAEALDLKGSSAYVKVSKIKKQAVQKLIDNVDPSQVLDYT